MTGRSAFGGWLMPIVPPISTRPDDPALSVVYGVLVWGFAMLWACLVGAITVRTMRAGMPFSLTWWSFTFPVGTCVTGTSALALHTGADLFHYAAVVFYAGLVLAWVTVVSRTVHGSFRGTLFRAPALPAATT